MSRHLIAAVAAALAVLAPAELSAQQPTVRSPRRVPATVAMVDSLPVRGVSFVVQRRPDRQPADLILLLPNATPADLSDAVRTLATARASGGDYPIAATTVRMRPRQKSPIARREFPWTRGTLVRLRNAKPRTVEGVGTVRAVAIWLPRQVRTGGAMGVSNNPQ